MIYLKIAQLALNANYSLTLLPEYYTMVHLVLGLY